MAVLENKQYKQYDTISRYSNSPIYYHKLDNKWVTELGSQLKYDTAYSIHQVMPYEDYDVISLEYYNTPLLYWVICDFNNIQDPFEPPKPGTTLKIPDLSKLEFA